MTTRNTEERHVRLFKNGRNQAIRIPREFELPGDTATLRREGSRLIIEPMERPSLQSLFSSWQPMSDELPPFIDLPAEDVDL
jgi:antitoxin VapB